jgi:integrase
MTTRELASRYQAAILPRLHPGWADRTRGILAELVEALGPDQTVNESLRPERIEGVAAQIEARRNPTTAAKYIRRLRHFARAAARWGYIPADPTAGIRTPREAPGRVAVLTPEHRERLLHLANRRLRPYVLWALYTGARRASLMALTEGDIDLQAGVVTFRRTKNGQPHRLPLHPRLVEWLQTRLTGDPRRPLLPAWSHPANLTQAFRRLARRAGLPSLRFHDLRHDVGSRLAMAGYNERAIMDVLGHRDPRSTARYTHLTLGHVRTVVASL